MAGRVVLAFDSFKGSLGSVEACAAAAEGVVRAGAEADELPLSDGGEGFVNALVRAASGTEAPCVVTGPLFEKVAAKIGLIGDGSQAVVEVAQACGLGLVPPAKRSPLWTTTVGVGEMLLFAQAQGARSVVVGLGGSVTNDGGMGMLTALGWKFYDSNGRPLKPVGASLERIARAEPGRKLDLEIVAACDVRNPLFGPEGAAYVYAGQKGADKEEVERLDLGLRHFASVIVPELASRPGAGAAGGLGFALHAFLDAKMRSGADFVVEASRLVERLKGADFCLTGEGRTDAQTAYGKLPAAVAETCKKAGVPCACISGALGLGWEKMLAVGCSEVVALSAGPEDDESSCAEAGSRLARVSERLARVYLAEGRNYENRRT